MAGPYRILIVDDDVEMQRLLYRCIEPLGYEVTCIGNGLEAMEMIEGGQFNVVILDLMLPEIHGLEILRRLQGRAVDTLIVVLTGQASLSTAVEALRLGAYDYLIKPFSIDAIRTAVRRALETQQVGARLSVVQALSRQLTLLMDVDQVVQAVQDIASRVLSFQVLGLWLVDEATNELYWRAGGIALSDLAPRLSLNGDRGIVVAAARSGQPLYVPDVSQDERYVDFGKLSASELAMPMEVEGRVVGVLNLESDQLDAYTPEDVRLVSILATQAAIALSSAGLHQAMRQELAERERAERALRESEEKYRDLVENISDVIFSLDADGVVTYVSPVILSVAGTPAESIVGRHFVDLSYPDDAERMKREFVQVMQGSLQSGEFRIRVADGTVRWMHFSARPILSEGQVQGVRGSVRDITGRKLVEEDSRRRMRAIETLNKVGQILTSSLDLGETLTFITQHTTELLGVAATSLVLIDDVRGDLYFAAASGEEADFVLGRRLEFGQGIAGWVIDHGESAFVPDVHQDPRWFGGVDRESAFTTRSVLCVPLYSKGQVIGSLSVFNKHDGAFTEQDLWLLSSLAAPAATAIENARLFEQLRVGREQLQVLSRRLVEVQEAERGHVARELHDETGQALSYLLLGLSLMEREADQPKAVIARAQEMEGMVDEMLENLHRLAMNLRPATLDYLGLVPALEQYIDTFIRQHGIAAQFQVVNLEQQRLPPATETALYRVVQEALTNVGRHAQARHVDVLIELRRDAVFTVIEDDGVGFDPEVAMQSGRMGLFGMRERAEMLGGRLTIESGVGKGTTILVEIPNDDSNSDR